MLAKLERLEACRSSSSLPRVIFAVHPAECPGEVIGFEAGNVRFDRRAHETVSQCRERALAGHPAMFLVTLYSEPPQCNGNASGHRTSQTALSRAHGAPGASLKGTDPCFPLNSAV